MFASRDYFGGWRRGQPFEPSCEERTVEMLLTSLVFLSLVSAISKPHTVRDRVDLVEVNHYHDDSGRHVFDQLIFYDWNATRKRFDVRAWRLIKRPSQLPRRDHAANIWRVIWHDGGVLRTVEAAAHRETWTQYDPELVNREYLPQEQRKDLAKVPEHVPRFHVSGN
jgi:hypothetical protein